MSRTQRGDDPIPEDVRRALKADARNRHRFGTLGGLAVAPLVMGGTWLLTRNLAWVNAVGNWLFFSSLVVLACCYLLFDRCSRRLNAVRHDVSVTVQGLAGPVREQYDSRYAFDSFTVAHLAAYRKMHTWGMAALFAFYVQVGYVLTLLLGSHDGTMIRLAPGMSHPAEIKTGARRVSEILLSPIQHARSEG